MHKAWCPIFFENGDQEVYRDLLAEQAQRARVAIWAYCLMPNHVHLVVVPDDEDGLGRAIGETHRLGASGLAELLCEERDDEAAFATLRGAETKGGRPLGNEDFIASLERLLGRPIARRAPGRKPATPALAQPNLL